MAKKVILITGANQGLGEQIALKLAREESGYEILMASRVLSKGESAASAIKDVAQGTRVKAIELDVMSDASIRNCFQKMESEYGYVDVLINNAGISRVDKAYSREQMMDVFNTNTASQAVMTEIFLPLVQKPSMKRIIFMSSDLGSITSTLDPNYAYYSFTSYGYKTSKAALNMLGAIFSVKYGDTGVSFHLVNPRFRATNLNDHNKLAGKKEDGAIEACRITVQGGENASYTEIEGPLRW